MSLDRQGRFALLWITHGGKPQVGHPPVQVACVIA
jgi:hypothetical protein